MRPFAALVVVTLLIGSAKPDDPPPKKKGPTAAEELQRFQGSWNLEGWEESGKAFNDEELKTRGVFFGGNIFFFRRNNQPFQVGTVQLDPNKSPGTANFSIREGEGKDSVMLGIYAIDGDTLKLCFDPQGQARPKNFKPDAKDGCTLITLRKPKRPADETIEIVGKFRSEMSELNGKTSVTDAVIERHGDGYRLTYTLGDKVLFIGTALRKGDQLSMCWLSAGQVGVSVYKIEAGPKLVGEYTVLGGIGMTVKEVLTPWKKTD